MTNLTKYDIALIGVKLLAIYVALQAIGSIPTWVMTLSMIFSLILIFTAESLSILIYKFRHAGFKK